MDMLREVLVALIASAIGGGIGSYATLQLLTWRVKQLEHESEELWPLLNKTITRVAVLEAKGKQRP